MALTDEEERLLKELEEKRNKDNVIRLVPGGQPSNEQIVGILRGILKDAEKGKYIGCVFVGLEPGDKAYVQYSTPTSFPLLGAMQKALILLSGA